ncbi:succinate dehydrogenase assembly factor 2 [Candidatus Pelagibacter sp.]|uniref:succinate dehydrogenase assembly factor 2 n=1 Tax=Candidatus Pelagibacter sp. TaxID=2024849 RepID=UPI003D0F40EF
MDKLLGKFVKKYINDLQKEDLIDLDKFLNIDDANLYNFYNGFDTEFEIEKNNISLLFKNFKY